MFDQFIIRQYKDKVSEINRSILPIQFVLECEELNEKKIPLVTILLPPLLGGKCSVFGGPTMNLQRAKIKSNSMKD